MSEHSDQAALFAWAATMAGQVPELRLMFAIPNQGKRSPAAAAWLRAEGLKPGVPDVFLPAPRGGWAGLFLELKAVGAPKPRIEQLDWHIALRQAGYEVTVCVGWDAARRAIEDYLSLDERDAA